MEGLSRRLYLCGGLQSSGSTLISWCFLQRPDMNGRLDASNDLVPWINPALALPRAWYKTTICCFRLSELVAHYRDEGWDVRPLLVIRDVRDVWASLQGKYYARNGITAEDPPLRMRFRRFLEDWRTFCEQGWPLLKYEDFLAEPRGVLEAVCRQLELPWDEAMLDWPKPSERIADTRHGNHSFRRSRRENLRATLADYQPRSRLHEIPPEDLRWLEAEFAEFNAAHDYPRQISVETSADAPSRAVPQFESARRFKWELRRVPLRWLLHKLGYRDKQWHRRLTGRSSGIVNGD